MPRVNTATKSTRGKAIKCGRCGQPIEPGQRYLYWQFRYGGKRTRHEACGRPRPSELTSSDKLSRLYAAQEGVEDFLAGEWAELADLAEALEAAASEARDVAAEYELAADAVDEHFPGSYQVDEIRDKASEAEQWADELESAASEVQGLTAEDCNTCEGSGEVEEDEAAGGDVHSCDECDGTGKDEAGLREQADDLAQTAVGALTL